MEALSVIKPSLPVSQENVVSCARSVLEKTVNYNVEEIYVTLMMKDINGNKMRVNMSSEF
jgi:hypothetical protein